MLITANNINIIRQKQHILQDVCLHIPENTFTTIIGANGAGKSTLLKVLIGLEKPHSGHINRAKNLVVGYVPQDLYKNSLIPMTVKHFLLINKKYFKSKKHNESAMKNVATEVQIENILHKQLSTLSGGELQRTLLARSLLNQPNLLVLDEPTKNLDIKGQLEFYQLLKKLHKERNISILMVSHDLHLMSAFTENVICLQNKILCCGNLETVIQDEAFLSLFGDEMNYMLSLYQNTPYALKYRQDNKYDR